MESAEEFLSTGQKFQLGFLETEKPHPKTVNLSELANTDVSKAIRALVAVDCEALHKLKEHVNEILELRDSIQATWKSGGRVFLCGCGATGRLSLMLECLYREQNPQSEKVISFMAGGDVALVHSLEGFEDFPEFGERHLRQLGFAEQDLLLAVTEGGETPYVIGAAEAAAKVSRSSPYFLYCNHDSVLREHVERSRRVIDNKNIKKINLCVGPMALTGSTRMQASTVLQLAIGFALLTDFSAEKINYWIENLRQYLIENAEVFLPPFIKCESSEYQAGRYIFYHVHDYPISVFTDTTERAPTFSLTPFSHKGAERLLKMQPSLCYICLPGTKTSEDAWHNLLRRSPRALNWHDIDSRTKSSYLHAFDFSLEAIKFRNWLTNNKEHSNFEILRGKDTLLWRLQDKEMSILWPQDSFSLFEHTLLKMFLNIHSTLIMGILGRYERNLMTWVYPTNGKLIDRATRYVQALLKEEGIIIPYQKIVEKLFDVKKTISGNESIVLATFAAFIR
ncbi:MAG: hypothetical protein A2Z20_05050 [Bdellovibrionales bacterium RBG_16_40_8]|nr:MAG: hypothetical protein A2Z20_05050 [Bdellovibrionales bacterium RBG_16_40_8]